jgi:hypothetical protein
MVFWDVILYSLVKRYKNLEEPAASVFNIDCILSQKIVIFLFTTGRTSDFYNSRLAYDVYLMRREETMIYAPCNIIYSYFWLTFRQLDFLFSMKFVMSIGSFDIRFIFAINELPEEQWWMQNHKNFWKICVFQIAVNFPIILLKCHYVYV